MAEQSNESGGQIFVCPANQIWAKNKLKKRKKRKRLTSITH